MIVLALNGGSSSLKLKIIDLEEDRSRVIAVGAVEALGPEASIALGVEGGATLAERAPVTDLETAIERAVAWIDASVPGGSSAVEAVGHRVVHGGARFTQTTRIDASVEKAIEDLVSVAPLHNAPGLAGIRAARRHFTSRPMVAVFDTAFHASLPDAAATYAIPLDLSRAQGIRRYGFHGLSYMNLVERLPIVSDLRGAGQRIVAFHLGSGCSAAAIRGGRSLETSMGFSPLEGLVMGTRAGDLDPAIPFHLMNAAGMAPADVERILQHESGLAGLSGTDGDVRSVISAAARGDARSRLALEVFVHRARKYLGAYLAVLGGADAVTFSGGIGERSPEIRAAILEGMDWCGVRIDPAQNARVRGGEARVSPEGARPEVWVIGADEERVIARETARCLGITSSG